MQHAFKDVVPDFVSLNHAGPQQDDGEDDYNFPALHRPSRQSKKCFLGNRGENGYEIQIFYVVNVMRS